MTPLEIEILLHYYCTGGSDYRDLDAPAIKEAIDKFCKHGILRVRSMVDKPTYVSVEDPMCAYVNAICAIPLPKQKWII